MTNTHLFKCFSIRRILNTKIIFPITILIVGTMLLGKEAVMDYESSTINSDPGKRTDTVKEISHILGIGTTAAYKLVHSGVFKTVQIGSTIRVSKQSFDEWLDRQM